MDLLQYVSKYLDKPNRNKHTLANESNVSYSTISRFVSNERTPQVEYLIKIAKVVMPTDEFVAYARKLDPVFSEMIDLAVDTKENPDFDFGSLANIFSSPAMFKICMLASYGGIDRESLIRKIGEEAFNLHVNQLLNLEVLKEKNNRYFFNVDYYDLDSVFEAYKKSLELAKERFISDREKIRLHMSWQNRKISSECYERLLEQHRIHLREYDKLIKADDGEKNKTIFMGQLLNIFSD